jgi:hypothetical protein
MTYIPSQIRTIDPYSSYHSNITNRLTRLVTKGDDVILDENSVLLETIDSTSSVYEITVSTGYVIKDDVLIIFDEEVTVDFTNNDFYPDGIVEWDEEGIYYLTVDYIYQKTKPAPQAGLIILKPSQTSLISSNRYLFLGAIDVEDIGGSLSITGIYDYDPNNSTIKREYSSVYQSSSKIIDELEKFGIFVNKDRTFVGQTIDVEPEFDTTSTIEDYDLVYKNPDDDIYYLALADETISQVGVGIADVTNNRVVFVGLIRTDYLSFSPGDDLFLSSTTPGSLTTNITTLQVGQCIDDNGLIMINIGAGSGGGQGDPYLSKLYLESNRTFTVPSNYGAVVPDRYEVPDDSELVIEDDGVFEIV